MLKQLWVIASGGWTLAWIGVVVQANPGQPVTTAENVHFVLMTAPPWILGYSAMIAWRLLIRG